jgi:hypothetical protein
VGGDFGLRDGVAPVLQREELVFVQRVREPCHIACDEHVVGDQAVDVKRAAARVAAHPPGADRQTRPVQPFGVPDRAERHYRHLSVDRRCVGEVSTAQPAVAVTLQRGDRDPAAQVHAMLTLHVRGHGADHAAQGTDQGRRAPFYDGDRQVPLSAHRGDLGAGEPAADDQDLARALRQAPVQAGGVVAGTQREHAVECGLGFVEPGAGPRPGGDQQPVVLHHATVGEAHLLAGQIKARCGHAEQPPGVEPVAGRQPGVLGGYPALEHLLGKRRAIVGLVRLIPDDRERAGKPLKAQRRRGS